MVESRDLLIYILFVILVIPFLIPHLQQLLALGKAVASDLLDTRIYRDFLKQQAVEEGAVAQGMHLPGPPSPHALPPRVAEAASSQWLQRRRGWGLPTWGLLGGDDCGGDDGGRGGLLALL